MVRKVEPWERKELGEWKEKEGRRNRKRGVVWEGWEFLEGLIMRGLLGVR